MLFFRQAALDRISALTGATPAELRRFRQELSEGSLPDQLLRRGANLAITRELPQGSLLYLLVRALRPGRVVETGIRPGYSTAWMLAALEANGSGELLSLGPGTVAGRASGVPAGEVGQLVAPALRARWTLVLGNSTERLEEILADREPGRPLLLRQRPGRRPRPLRASEGVGGARPVRGAPRAPHRRELGVGRVLPVAGRRAPDARRRPAPDGGALGPVGALSAASG